MTDVLVQRFDAIANTRDDADWLDVQRRARGRGVPRPLLVVAGVIAAIAVVAPAFGLHRVVIDFLSAEHAPERVQVEFSQLGIMAPVYLGPDVVPNSARKVMDVRLNGKVRPVYVAPTRDDGFCVRFVFTSSCRYRTPPTGQRPLYGNDLKAYVLGAHGTFDGAGVAQMIAGSLLDEDVEVVSAEFADGSSLKLSITWVSPPIDAGFYFLDIPEEHRHEGAQLVRLVARDSDGDDVARQNFPLPKPGDVERPARLPNGELVILPRKAIVERARQVISIQASTGDEVSIWVMPTTEGGVCYIWRRGRGCPPAGWKQDMPMVGGLASGGRPMLFQAQVVSRVATVELRYEDGTVERLLPVSGFVLGEVTAAHYERGHRLLAAIALDASGDVLQRQALDPAFPGVYPCDERVEIRPRIKMCP
jgi:hypothetical protein